MAAPETRQPPSLRLHVLDSEEVVLLSALAQDALVRVGDIGYEPAKRRFALVGSRFDREAETEGRLERVRAGLHFEGVTRVRHQGVARDRPDAVMVLLAVTFEPGPEPPDGLVRLIFAGGVSILLDVECVEAQFADIGPRWTVACCPCHDLDENAGGGP